MQPISCIEHCRSNERRNAAPRATAADYGSIARCASSGSKNGMASERPLARNGSRALAGETEKAALQRHLTALLPADGSMTVLEAGCGSYSHVAAGPEAYVVGIDISADQLEQNTHVHEKVLGDIQTHDLGDARFDMIVSWDVLEHLAAPNSALERFARALRPGGLIV